MSAGAVVSIARDGADAARAALERTIGSGGVAVFPADGLYGLACDPLNPDAIARVHELKGRDDGKPSAVMYFAPLILRELLGGLGHATREALAALLPGPVTVVVHNAERRYPLACREDPERLGIRLIEGPLTGAACPVLQTSANFSGEPAPASFRELVPAIRDGADLAIDGGQLTGLPSTVVDLTGLETGGEGSRWSILRHGAMPEAEVARRLAALASHRAAN